MKTPSSTLKNIATFINICCFFMAAMAAIVLVILPFAPPSFEFNYQFVDQGIFNGADGNTYPFTILNLQSTAIVSAESAPNYAQNFYLFLQYLIGLFFLFQLKDFINSITENKAFQMANYQRLKYMGLALIVFTFLKVAHFFLIYKLLVQSISHQAIEVDSTFSLIHDFAWNPFLYGLLFLILAEAFKEGFLLKQENSLTI